MDSSILVACIAGLSSVAGSCAGVVATSRMTNYRLEQLESKVNDLIKRDDDVIILKEQMKGVINDVQELKKR